MEGFAIIWAILIIILGICITIAPLIIWRNTNRTNRLLALMLLRQGVPANVVVEAYGASGSSIGGVPGSGGGFKDIAKKVVEDFKISVEDVKPEPAKPTARFCPNCGSDAPLDATSCPNCTRILAEHPVHCPKCGHEITHQPAECPGCGTKYRYTGKTP